MKIMVVSPKNKTVFNFRGDLIKDMIAHGNEVVVTGPNQDFIDDIMKLGVSKFVEVPLVKDNTNIGGDFAYCHNLYNVMKQEKPDIIFSYTIKPVIYSSIAARFAGIKRVCAMVTGLGRVYASNGLKTKILRTIIKFLYTFAFTKCDKVIFQNSDDLHKFIQEGYLSSEKAVQVNGSGVNMKRFTLAPLPKTPVFLMVGRIIREKGVMEYCEAARAVRKKYPQARFILLGGFDVSIGALKKEDIQPYIDDGSIEFPGEVKDPVSFYHKCSVFVLPSYYREGLPRTILEAMSCGRPVITTDWPGCREPIVDGENGWMVPVKDSLKLIEVICKFIENPLLLTNMSKDAYKHCKNNYEVSVVNQQMRNYIQY